MPFAAERRGRGHRGSHRDEFTEARWVADRIVGAARRRRPWSDVAVLCRTSRLFFLLQQAFAERDIPVSRGPGRAAALPEVVEVLAYARAATTRWRAWPSRASSWAPATGWGSRTSRWSPRWAKGKNYQWREEGPTTRTRRSCSPRPGASRRGRGLVRGRHRPAGGVPRRTRRPPHAGAPARGEFLGEVIRRIGIVDELDADLDRVRGRPRGATSRRSSTRCTVRAGRRRTHAARVPRLRRCGRGRRQAGMGARPAQRRGLRQGHDDPPGQGPGVRPRVRARGWRTACCPTRRIQQNPAERGNSLDFELRGDAAILPRFDGVPLRTSSEDLQRPGGCIEERRTCTSRSPGRAAAVGDRRRTGTARTSTPKGPSEFFAELAAWGTDSGEATVDGGGRAPHRGRAEPLFGLPRALVRDWPGPARPDERRRTVPVRVACAPPSRRSPQRAVQAALVDSLEGEDRGTFERAAAERRQLASHLRDREAVEGGPGVERVPADGRRQRRHHLRAVPQALLLVERSSAPAVQRSRGAHRHRDPRLDRAARSGQGQLLEMDDRPDLTDEELAGDPGRVERLRDAFTASRFADVVAAVRRARVPAAAGRLVRRRAHRRDLRRRSTGRGRSSTGRPAASPRRPTHRRPAARPLRPGLPSRSGARRPSRRHAHVLLPRQRRGGHPAHGRPRRGAAAGPGLARCHRGGRVRPHPGLMVPALRFPELLRRGEGMARGSTVS